MDYTWYAELFCKQNDIMKAKDKLKRAIAFFKKCEANGWLEVTHKELSSLP